MSSLTATLLNQRKCRADSKWPSRLDEATDKLVARYGVPALGNFRDPVKEIFYILLSARTSEVLYQRAHKTLFTKYGSLEKLADAPPEDVLVCIRGAGLGMKRASQVVGIAQRLLEDFGSRPQAKLRKLDASAAFLYLTSLPGVGPKSALCVMMWSLEFDVLPVDVNVQRVFERLGMIPRNSKHYQAQQLIPRYVPPGRCLELHSALMVHGREVCVPGIPRCEDCVIADYCKRGRKSLSKK